MTRIIEGTSDQSTADMAAATVFMAFVLQPKAAQEPSAPSMAQWGIMSNGQDGKLTAKVGTADTRRGAFDAILTALNLSTDASFTLPFTEIDTN